MAMFPMMGAGPMGGPSGMSPLGGGMPGMPMPGGMPGSAPQGGEPQGVAGKLAALAMEMLRSPQVAQGFAFSKVMENLPKLFKAERTVPALAPKMTATTPFEAPQGRADQAALQQMQMARAQGMPPGGGMPGGAPVGPGGPGGLPGMPGGGGAPGMAGGGMGGLLALLASRMGGGGRPMGGL